MVRSGLVLLYFPSSEYLKGVIFSLVPDFTLLGQEMKDCHPYDHAAYKFSKMHFNGRSYVNCHCLVATATTKSCAQSWRFTIKIMVGFWLPCELLGLVALAEFSWSIIGCLKVFLLHKGPVLEQIKTWLIVIQMIQSSISSTLAFPDGFVDWSEAQFFNLQDCNSTVFLYLPLDGATCSVELMPEVYDYNNLVLHMPYIGFSD